MIYSKELWIEKDDAKSIAEGEKVTLMKWGNVTISKKEETEQSIVLTGKIDRNDKDFKKTKKITWISSNEATTVEVTLV